MGWLRLSRAHDMRRVLTRGSTDSEDDKFSLGLRLGENHPDTTSGDYRHQWVDKEQSVLHTRT